MLSLQHHEQSFSGAFWSLIKEHENPKVLFHREARQIAKANMAQIKKFEALKKRKNVPESEYLTTMKDSNNVVEFDDLHTYFFTDAGTVKAVDGVTFNIPHGSIVGVVGESGCGKSVTSMSLMRLVQGPTGQIVSGSIRFKGIDYKKDEKGEKAAKAQEAAKKKVEKKSYCCIGKTTNNHSTTH